MRTDRHGEIGGYLLLGPLGAGGMGTVYRARDGDGRVVALKLLHAHLGADPKARERLSREVTALRRVRHPGIARVLDAELDSAEAFIVTELVDGRDLGAHIDAHGPVTPGELVEFADHLRAAIEVVHAAGVLHRDLTPGNVMVTDAGPVLIDFGVAQAVEDARVTSTGLVMGTPGYVAPEILAGEQPSCSADWWGWAALLAFAATGRAPFGGGSVAAILARVCSGEADLAGLDQRTQAVLRSALAVDGACRISPDEVVEQLVLAEEGDTGTPCDLGAVAGSAAAADAVPTCVMGGDGQTRVMTANLGDPDVVRCDDEWTSGGEAHHSPEEFENQPDLDVGRRGNGRLGLRRDHGGPSGGVGFVPQRRTGTLLALGLPLVALGLGRPGVAVVLATVCALLARSVGLDVEAVGRRWERRGRRRSDIFRGVAAWPWHLLRAVVGIAVAGAVGIGGVVVVGGVLWWLLDTGRVVIAAPLAGEDGGLLTANAEWVGRGLTAVLVGVAFVALWFGPLSRTTRAGAEWVLYAVAPETAGVTVVVAVVVGIAVVVGVVVLGQEAVWWPLAGPPDPG